jgi:sarcosine/dimethylglycine N-methyltransferase
LKPLRPQAAASTLPSIAPHDGAATMNKELDLVRDHYQAAITDPSALLASISSALDAIEGPITARQIGNFDHFHIGGLTSSIELAERLAIAADAYVLDAGSGLGGPSRYLAETFGCRVVGVDLAPDYVAIARLLADKSGLAEKVSYVAGSITDLPFPDETFDLVWTQHVVMNIRDRDGLYREIRRVLKKGGRLAFYDPYVPSDGEPPHYPTPWAENSATSTLFTHDATAASLEQAHLRLRVWDDVSEPAKVWIERQQQQLQQSAAAPGGPSLSPGLVVGARMQPMVANFARNVREGRIRLVMGICEAI